MFKHVALLMIGVGLVACGGEAPQSSSSDMLIATGGRSPASPSVSGSAATPSTANIGSGSAATPSNVLVVRGSAPSTPNVWRGAASLASAADTINLGTIPLLTRGANGATTGALASVAATVTNTSSTWSSGGLTVSLTGASEIVMARSSCADQVLSPQGACQDSYMLDCTGTATQGVKNAVVTVTDSVGGASTTFAISGTCDVAAAGAAQIAFTPTSTDFGGVVQDTSSAVQKLTLTNTGSGATDLLPAPVVSGSSEFSIDASRCTSASLAMNGICAVSVYLNCNATTPGTKSGSVTYTAPNGGTVATATFTGTCVAAGAGVGCSYNSDCASGICNSTTYTCN